MFGFPGFYFLDKLRLVNWWMCSVYGFAAPVAAMAIFELAGPQSNVIGNLRQEAMGSALVGGVGIMSAFAAWLTWYLLGRCMTGPRRMAP